MSFGLSVQKTVGKMVAVWGMFAPSEGAAEPQLPSPTAEWELEPPFSCSSSIWYLLLRLLSHEGVSFSG